MQNDGWSKMAGHYIDISKENVPVVYYVSLGYYNRVFPGRKNTTRHRCFKARISFLSSFVCGCCAPLE